MQHFQGMHFGSKRFVKEMADEFDRRWASGRPQALLA